MSRPTSARARRRPGFTLVELLVVLVILALLIALLLPAINAAIRKARNAQVTAEINAIGQALASFKSKYGDYPPSSVVLVEDGDYSTGNLGTFAPLQGRSVSYLRKFWPMVNISAAGATMSTTSTTVGSWFDFNGNGVNDGKTPMLLQGHQCLVFFLGGLPMTTSTGLTMTGFSKNPANPFVNAAAITNRTTPYYEFNNGRLLIDPSAASLGNSGLFPGYSDTLGPAADPSQPPFYAYFSAYNGVGYDPDDVNFPNGVEIAPAGGAMLGAFMAPNDPTGVAFKTRADWFSSPYPNPYVNDQPIPTSAPGTPDTTNFKPRAWQNPQSYQLISPGADRLYGIGGQYSPNASETLPFDQAANAAVTGQTLDTGARSVEHDNLSNFATGTLE